MPDANYFLNETLRLPEVGSSYSKSSTNVNFLHIFLSADSFKLLDPDSQYPPYVAIRIRILEKKGNSRVNVNFWYFVLMRRTITYTLKNDIPKSTTISHRYF
jgi:hypothetical protein